MKYKIYLDAIQCDRFCCNFIRSCDLGIEEYGTPVIISFTIDEEPTKELIDRIIELHLKSKEEKSLKSYFSNIKLNRIELIDLLEREEEDE